MGFFGVLLVLFLVRCVIFLVYFFLVDIRGVFRFYIFFRDFCGYLVGSFSWLYVVV